MNIDEEDKRLAEKYGITEEMIKAGASKVWNYPIEDYMDRTAAIRIYAAMKSQETGHCS